MSAVAHPWPTWLGAGNAGATTAEFGDRGETRWSAELPFRVARGIIASRDGSWVAAGDRSSIGGDAAGARWPREVAGTAAVLTGDGRVVLGGARLSVHRTEDGRSCWSVDEAHGDVVETASGRLIAIGYEPRRWSLIGYGSEGAVSWRVAIDAPIAAPLSMDDEVIVASPTSLLAFDLDGAVVWRMTAGGFDAAAPAHHGFTSAPFAIDGRRFGIASEGPEAIGLLIADTAERTLTPWRAANGTVIATMSPHAVCRRPETTTRSLVYRHMTTAACIEVDGAPIWEHLCTTEPVGFATDPRGRTAIAYSHSIAHHDAYAWYEEGSSVRDRCGVVVIDPRGDVAWSWSAPGLVSGLAVAADGSILVSSEGRLWAIG